MPISYRKISGADLAKGIEAANVTKEQFSALYGVRTERVEKWLQDKAEIPHGVALFVGLIADPLVLEKALIITQYMVDKTDAAPETREKRSRDERRAEAGKARRARKDAKGETKPKGGREERIKARRLAARPPRDAEDPETGSASQKRRPSAASPE